METLVNDVRYALRTLRRSPAFAAFAILILGIGIGANSAVFSLVNGMVLRPLPYPDSDRIISVWQDYRQRGGNRLDWASPADFLDWQETSESFASLTALGGWTPTLTGDGLAERLTGAVASYTVFQTLGVHPTLGRGFLPEDDLPGAPQVVVISDELWHRQFGGDRGVIGRTLELGAAPYEVIGVMPPGFRFIPIDEMTESTDVIAPIRPDVQSCGRGCITYRVIGRLTADATLAAAQVEMEAITGRLAEAYPETNDRITPILIRAHDYIVGDARPALFVLLAAVGFVLLIACANVASLLLARSVRRGGELAVRTALGAGRGRIIRQLLTESLVLGLIGGSVGTIAAVWGVDLLTGLIPASAQVPFTEQTGVDRSVLLFTLAISLATGIGFGLAPALQAARPNLAGMMQGRGGRSGTGTRRSGRTRATLVVAEVALALVLLVGATLLIKSFANLTRVDPGFDADGLVTMNLFLPGPRYPEVEDRRAFYLDVTRELRDLPDVESAAAVSTLPMSGGNEDVNFRIEGRPPPEPGHRPTVWYRRVTPDYLSSMRIEILRGREITDADHADAPLVAVINEAMVRAHWPDGQDPVGSVILLGSRSLTVIGVARDIRNWGLDQDARPSMYLAFAQFPTAAMTLVARGRTGAVGVAETLRQVIADRDPTLAAASIVPMRTVISDSIVREQFLATLLTVFAGAALVLSAIGLYGVMTYTVTERTREIGIRIALGADPTSVRGLVVLHGMRLVGIGLALGLVGSVAVSRLLDGLLYDVAPSDPATYALVPLMLATVACAATYLPARIATRVDPMEALRYD